MVLKLNKMLVSVSGRDKESPVKYNSKLRYAKRLIRCVNKTEDEVSDQKSAVQQAK